VNHDLSFSGGSKNARFYAGFGYLDQNGIVIFNYSSRYSARINSDFTLLKEHLKIGENLSLTYRKEVMVPNLSDESPFQAGPYRSQSIIPVIITDTVNGPGHQFLPGEWGGTGMAPRLGNAPNEVAALTRNKNNPDKNTHLTGNIYFDVKIVKGLIFRSLFGGIMDDGSGIDYSLSTYESSENTSNSTVAGNTYKNHDRNWTNTFTYNLESGKHKINAIAGFETMNFGSGNQVYYSHNLSDGSLLDSSSYTLAPVKMMSLFLKADYSFMDRYLVSAVIRRDNSSRFAGSNANIVLPAFSAGWILSNETFLQRLSWLSFLKIRGSYGLTGDQGALSSGSYIAGPDAKYGVISQADIGLDARILKNKVGIIFDIYSKRSTGILFNLVNSASMTNKGFDAEVSYKNRWGDLSLNGALIFTTYNNKITALAPGVNFFDESGATTRIGTANRNEVGHPISSFFGYVIQGIFQDSTEVKNAPVQDGKAPGTWRYRDIDGNDTIDGRDRTFIGDPNPKFTYGLNLTLTYKGFDLSAFFYGSQGNDLFNWNKWFTDFWPSFQGQKSKALLYDSWTPANTTATLPMASNTSDFSTNTQVTSFYIENGSFLRLKTLQLGYTIPARIMNKVRIRDLRVYVQAANLFTITRYSGLDPEIGGVDPAFGADTGNYPNVKQFIFGINLAL
jgi:TonB-dependent starch-binding outer membrane protein SusC